MTHWQNETKWLEVIEAIEVCLENDVSFSEAQMPNGPPDKVAKLCVDVEDPRVLDERQRNVVDKFIIPVLKRYECAACSARLAYTQIADWFDNGQRCMNCAQPRH